MYGNVPVCQSQVCRRVVPAQIAYLEVTLVFLPEVDSRKGESSCSLQNVCLERTSKRGMKGMRFYENFWKITPR